MSEQNWVYSSGPLAGTGTVIDGPATFSSPIAVGYTLDLTLAAPLGDNLVDASVTPMSWSLACAICPAAPAVLTPGVTENNTGQFAFSTDAAGQITGAMFNVQEALSQNGQILGTLAISPGALVSTGGMSASRSVVQVSGAAGTWTDPPLQAQEISGVGAVAGVTLLLCAVAILTGRRR